MDSRARPWARAAVASCSPCVRDTGDLARQRGRPISHRPGGENAGGIVCKRGGGDTGAAPEHAGRSKIDIMKTPTAHSDDHGRGAVVVDFASYKARSDASRIERRHVPVVDDETDCLLDLVRLHRTARTTVT
jgi:hypothetical protein